MPRTFASLAVLVGLLALALIALDRFGPSGTARGLPSASLTPSARTQSSPIATSSATRTVTLTYTADDLTAAARQYTPLTVSGITVTDPTITLDAGRLILRATGRAFLLSGPIVVVATPLVVNGKPAARIDSATLAGFALPDSTKQDIADTFARTLAANIPAGVRVTSITVGTGALVVQTVPA